MDAMGSPKDGELSQVEETEETRTRVLIRYAGPFSLRGIETNGGFV